MKNRILIIALVLVAILAAFGPSVDAQVANSSDLAATAGYTDSTLAIASGAAVRLPVLPAGKHGYEIIGDNAWNYGGASVSTGTAEAFVATLTVKVWDKIGVMPGTAPAIYIRSRGSDSSQTLKILFR
jgi:Tfp pilus assembly protein FimT